MYVKILYIYKQINCCLGLTHILSNLIFFFSSSFVFFFFFFTNLGSLPLPDILICPFNRYNRTFLEQHNVSESLAQYLEMSYPGTTIHQFQKERYNYIKKQTEKLDMDLQLLLKRLGNITFKEFVEMVFHTSYHILFYFQNINLINLNNCKMFFEKKKEKFQFLN